MNKFKVIRTGKIRTISDDYFDKRDFPIPKFQICGYTKIGQYIEKQLTRIGNEIDVLK